MQFRRYIIFVGFSLLLALCALPCFSQLGFSYNFKKPKEYENRTLRSEQTEQKKFNFPRRAIQNTVTHYNYVFNANNKLNDILDRAKQQHKDDYTELLSFYNYTLDATAADSIQLDSLTYKAQTGIAIHDLRGDWIDDLYLLWGMAYYLEQKYDSAYLMFQFINYAFAPKEKDGYYKTIGSRMDGNQAFSIATKEKNSITKKIFSEPPSRNDAFIWQIRNHLARDEFAEASSLIVTLKNDPAFPGRLQNDLDEVQAYMFYKQNAWDSSAAYLVEALGNASNKQEQARWEYLAGQLYELSHNYEQAEKYYTKSIGHATDPILDIYARLATIRVNKDGGDNYIEKNITSLLKMAKRDKYVDYRDIIYYTAAQMELERHNTDGAIALLLKSTKYTSNNASQKNKAFLQLAELSFSRHRYREAYNFYDSLNISDPFIKDPEAITKRKTILGKIAGNIEVIDRQDSLQRIAILPEEDRKNYVRKLARLLRKQQGLKEEGAMTTGSIAPDKAAPTLFRNDEKGEWYFYNASLRQKGQSDFKTRWGTRPNSDNWRRSTALMGQPKKSDNPMKIPNGMTAAPLDAAPEEVTFESLYDKLPLTPETKKKSDDSLQNALYELGKLYIQEIEDCAEGTLTYEDLRTRFPQHPQMDEVLFNLYYCYNKNGETAKANAIKALMGQKYPQSNYTTIVTTGKNPKDKKDNPEATKKYEDIYDLFIEGNFTEAVAQKKTADSIYGGNYWTPQLLYIEAVYYIRQREDSVAKNVLNNIINRFANTPMAAKAKNLRDVLGRRAQIEEELRNLVIVMPAEDSADLATQQTLAPRPVYQQPVVSVPVKDTAATQPVIPPVKDSAAIKPPVKDTAVAKPPVIPPKDTVVTKPPVRPPVKDTAATKPPVPPPANTFVYKPDVPHYVVLVLNKVDPVFVNEARNAFARHNKEAYFNKTMTAELLGLDNDNRLLLISPFKNAQEAIDYVDKTKPKAITEIIPWLKGGKYYFSVISEANLNLLKTTKELDKYNQFLQQSVPGKF